MLETVLTLVLAIALMWYIFTCERGGDAYENERTYAPMAFQADKGYPVVQYPRLPFARPSVPRTADPRVINPELAAVPVQFPEPRVFGTYGVTDSVASVWGSKDSAAATEYIKGEAPRPHSKRVTTLPLRTHKPASPIGADFVESKLGSLRGGPVELVDANLTPPGMARPLSEWAWINYGSQ